MISTNSIMSLLVGTAALIGTALPTPALARNDNNAALNQMAMQMYMQQQANAQNQAILAQHPIREESWAEALAVPAANRAPILLQSNGESPLA